MYLKSRVGHYVNYSEMIAGREVVCRFKDTDNTAAERAETYFAHLRTSGNRNIGGASAFEIQTAPVVITPPPRRPTLSLIGAKS